MKGVGNCEIWKEGRMGQEKAADWALAHAHAGGPRWEFKEENKEKAFRKWRSSVWMRRGENTYECGRVSPVGMEGRSGFLWERCGSSTRSGGLFEK